MDNSISHISRYFPDLATEMRERLSALPALYQEWNSKINVISRKDLENIEINHILHPLAIARFIPLKAESEVMDLGTGGGFPGIPLAIVFPEVKFHLIDRIGKKIQVASSVAEKIGLENVTFQHGDSGECRKKFDFVVSRAVMPQKDLIKAIRKNIAHNNSNPLPDGLISLKGGDLGDELSGLENVTQVVSISDYFEEPFFETKKIIYTKL